MIERLRESDEKAFGFRVAGTVTAEEVDAFMPQLEQAIVRRGKKTIGLLADLSGLGSVDAFGEGEIDSGLFPGHGAQWSDDGRPELDLTIDSGVGDVELTRG